MINVDIIKIPTITDGAKEYEERKKNDNRRKTDGEKTQENAFESFWMNKK